MNYLNKVELAGVVGLARTQEVSGKVSVNFSLCVINDYGNAISTEWFNCLYWTDAEGAKRVAKGAELHVEGRLSHTRYIDSEGSERSTYQVKVNKIY